MTDYVDGRFTTHHISTLDTGDRWGIPDTSQPVGVLRMVVGREDTHVTLIVDSEQAEMLNTATEYLEGEIEANASTIRWMRLGWPTEWETYFEPNAWIKCVDGHAADLQDGDAE